MFEGARNKRSGKEIQETEATMQREEDPNHLLCSSSLHDSRVSFSNSSEGMSSEDGALGSDVEVAISSDERADSQDKKPPSFMFHRQASVDEIIADAEVDKIYDQVFPPESKPIAEKKSMDEVQLELSAAGSRVAVTNKNRTSKTATPSGKKHSRAVWQRLCCSNIRLQFLLLCVILIATVVILGNKGSVNESQPDESGDNTTVVESPAGTSVEDVLTVPLADGFDVKDQATEKAIKVSPRSGIELDSDVESTGGDQDPHLSAGSDDLEEDAQQMTKLWQHLAEGDSDTGSHSSLLTPNLRFVGFVAEPISKEELEALVHGDAGNHTVPPSTNTGQLIKLLNMRGNGRFRAVTVRDAELVVGCEEGMQICKVFSIEED